MCLRKKVIVFSVTLTLTILVTPGVWVFHTRLFSDTSWVACISVQFWQWLEWVHIPQVNGSVPQAFPHFRCQFQVGGPQVTHNFCLTWLQIEESSFFVLDYLLEIAHRTQEHTYLRLLVYYIIKNMMWRLQMNSQTKRYIGWGLEGSPVQQFLSSWIWGAHRCVHQPGSSLSPVFLKCLRRFLHVSMINC